MKKGTNPNNPFLKLYNVVHRRILERNDAIWSYLERRQLTFTRPSTTVQPYQVSTSLLNRARRLSSDYLYMQRRLTSYTAPRITNNPLFNNLIIQINAYMRRYLGNFYDNVSNNILDSFRRVQFEPNDIGGRVYIRFMELFDSLNTFLFGQVPTIEAPIADPSVSTQDNIENTITNSTSISDVDNTHLSPNTTSMDSLILDIRTYMLRYYNLTFDNNEDLLQRFRSIEFEPSQIGTPEETVFTLLYNNLNVLSHIETNTTTNTTTSTTTTTTTTTSATNTNTSSTSETVDNYINVISSPIITLKNSQGNSYTTTLDSSTDISTLTYQYIRDELLKRQLVKVNEASDVTVDLESGETYTFTNKLSLKFTHMGVAYHKIIESQKNIPLFPHPSFDGANIEFVIIIGPVSSDTFMESTTQKHMLAAYNVDSEEYFVIGYFTSQANPDIFCKKQIKAFQANLNKSDNINSDQTKQDGKAQYFVEFKNAEKIPADQIKIIKNGKEYIKMSNQTDYLKRIAGEMSQVPYKEFNTNGISKKDCINICLAHDNNIKNKKPHPKTDPEIKNKENKENIKKAKEIKKMNKSDDKFKSNNVSKS